jgi:AraC-like DNA-binding protein
MDSRLELTTVFAFAHTMSFGTSDGMPATGNTKIFSQSSREALQPFVKRFLAVEFPAQHEDSHLPDTGFVAAFRVRGECRLEDGRRTPRASVTGLHDRLRFHAHGQGNLMVLAAFTPMGASALLRQPLDELANSTIGMDALISEAGSISQLEELLAEAPNNLRRIQLVENFLLARVGGERLDPLVAAAISWIENAPPGARIDQLVRHIGLSQSALERRFRRVVGTSPKRFASLVRLKKVVRLQAAGSSLTSVAYDAGYFDQSHFINDFKRVTGLAPESYFAR